MSDQKSEQNDKRDGEKSKNTQDTLARLSSLLNLNIPAEQNFTPGGALAGGKTKPLPTNTSASVEGQLERNEEHRRKLIAEARKNTQYYLGEATKTGQPWHFHVKTDLQYAELIEVTPDMLQTLLDFNNNPRLRIKQNVVKKYKRDIEGGHWFITSEALKIDINHEMYDGQHRCHAGVQANLPFVVTISFNDTVEARFPTDGGCPRTSAEKISTATGEKANNRIPAICRAMMMGLTQRNMTFSNVEIAQFRTIHAEVIDSVMKQLPKMKSNVVAVLCKAILWHGEETMQPFLSQLGGICFGEDEGLPTKRLFLWLTNSKDKNSQIKCYEVTLAAVDAFVKGRSISRLNGIHKDIFEWDADWKVPTK